MRLPLGYIYELLKLSAEHEKRRANIYSISTARLTSVVLAVANGFSGNKSDCKVKIDELLPFPLDENAKNEQDATETTVKALVKAGKLPLHVVAALSRVITL